MDNNFWKRKLSSRKFWAALIGAVGAFCALFGISAITTEQIIALLSSTGVLLTYIISETCLDLKNKGEKEPDNTEEQ